MEPPLKNSGRQQRRFRVNIPISAETLGIFYESQIMNISRGGVFIRADISLEVGSKIDFTFRLPRSGRDVHAEGVVVWSRSAGKRAGNFLPQHPNGMGIQFSQIDVNDLDALLLEIDHLTLA